MLLAYFMALERSSAVSQVQGATGLNGASLEWLRNGEVLCTFGAAGEELIHADSHSLREFALQFHKVVHAASSQCTVLPFRFPTFFPHPDAIRRFLEQHSSSYAAELRRLDGTVQMELHLARSNGKSFSSGAEYLRSRQEWTSRIKHLRDRVAALPGVQEERHASLSTEERIYVLLSRAALEDFRASVKTWQHSDKLRVSGPWPPVAFVRYQSTTKMDTEAGS